MCQFKCTWTQHHAGIYNREQWKSSVMDLRVSRILAFYFSSFCRITWNVWPMIQCVLSFAASVFCASPSLVITFISSPLLHQALIPLKLRLVLLIWQFWCGGLSNATISFIAYSCARPYLMGGLSNAFSTGFNIEGVESAYDPTGGTHSSMVSKIHDLCQLTHLAQLLSVSCFDPYEEFWGESGRMCLRH